MTARFNTLIIALFILVFAFGCSSKDDAEYEYRADIWRGKPITSFDISKIETFMISGASFATPNNGWIELACEKLNKKCINKAVSGSAITDLANAMYNSSFYSDIEFEQHDALVIMHVHNMDVINGPLKDVYNEYQLPFDRSNYAIAYDYVIKRYVDDCYQQKYNPKSKWYNSENGKPCKIILSTHWHDSREIFNSSIRALATKWNIPLVKFDENIGFTKNSNNLLNSSQPSIGFADNNEIINGITYGWHPKQGKDQYIQKKMADIFISEIGKISNR